jgi:AcrR family transcriptional regulator
MARKASITDERILEAARWVFLRKGIAGTTAEVAQFAHIAEGTVYSRFPTKQALFRAAMQPKFEEPEWLAALGTGPAGNPRQALAEAAFQALTFFRRIIPSVIMMWSNEREKGRLPEPLRGSDPLPLKALGRITSWFQQGMASGRMRRQDPEVLARVFLGSMQSYAFFELLLRAHGREVFDADRYLEGFVDQFWQGAAPRPKRKK